MIKKYFKTFFLVVVLLLSFNSVNAAEQVGIIKIKDTGAYSIGGYSYLQWMEKSTYETVKEVITGSGAGSYIYTSRQAAIDACNRIANVRGNWVCTGATSQTTYSSKYTCSGKTYSTSSACKNASYTTTEKVNGKCSRSFLGLIGKYKCSLSGSTKDGVKYDSQSACTSACYKYSSVSKKCSSNSSYCKYSSTSTTKWKYTYKTKGTVTEEHEYSYWTRGLKQLYIPHYATEGGDPTYCIQPGNKGPGAGTDYCLNTEIDLSKCETLNSPDHYYCGLAAILYQTVKEDGTYADGTTKYVDSGEYSYAAITTALRMWVAYYSQLDGMDNIGMESDRFNYISNTNVYKITANHLIKNAGYVSGTDCVSSLDDGVLCTYNGKTDYIGGLKLFMAAKNGGITFLDNEATKLNGPKFTASNTQQSSSSSTHTTTIKVEMPEKYVEKMVPCTKDELLNKSSACKVYAVVKDKNGNTVSGAVSEAFCEKEYCEVVITGEKKECSLNGGGNESTTYSLEVTLKEYALGGYVRQYVNCADPDASQVMMTFAFREKQKEIEGGDDSLSSSKYTYSINIPCYCDDEKRCNAEDMVPRTDLPESCEGQGVFDSGVYDTYTVGDKKDPYMNCILNACDKSEKDKYNYSAEYGVNTNVCNIYCRDEIYFYMANKTRVYAGMQFQYDIVPKLQADSVIEEPYINQVGKSNFKLSSVVLQKRQCTTEIYYDTKNASGKTWLDQYDEAVKSMMTAYNNWKHHESIYDWQMQDNGGVPQQITAAAKVCAHSSSSGCGDRSCYTSQDLPSFNYVYGWPTQSYQDGATSCSISSSNKESYDKWTASSGSVKGEEFTLTNGSGTHSLTSGSFNCGSTSCGSSHCCRSYSCRCGDAVTCGADEEGCTPKPDSMSCCCDSSYSTDGTCSAGSAGNAAAAQSAENSAWTAYKATVDKVAQLIYDLQNCNLYVDNGAGHEDTAPKIQYYYNSKVPTAYHGTNSGSVTKAKGNSSKDYILEKSSCEEADKCIELSVEYDDKNYGVETEFEREIGLVDSDLNGTYHCRNVDDANPNCYKYIKNTEVEVNKENYSSDKTKDHDVVYCDAGARTDAKCWTEKKKLPINDYATFITVTEADFWQPKKYQTQVYTGIVTEGDGSANGQTALDNFIYPVSNNNDTGKTGVYDIDYHFSNITLKSSADLLEYDHTCSYDVLNTTKLYDCEIKIDDTGNLDLSDCQNSCYEVKNGVPIIADECNSWDNHDSKGYGFIYRNVDVGNLFPNGLRGIGTNWDQASSVISQIESTADAIYVNTDYLEYRYVLSPTAINRIREYNQTEDSNGGYLNTTLSNCDMIDLNTGLKGFYNCKSSFLNDIALPNNQYGVDPKKTDGVATGGGN